MENFSFKKTFALVACTVSLNAFAGGWQGWTKVDSYVIERSDSGDHFYVNMVKDTTADNCSGNTSWKRIKGTTEKGKYMISSVIAAHVAKQDIQLHFSGCDEIGRNIVTGVMVK